MANYDMGTGMAEADWGGYSLNTPFDRARSRMSKTLAWLETSPPPNYKKRWFGGRYRHTVSVEMLYRQRDLDFSNFRPSKAWWIESVPHKSIMIASFKSEADAVLFKMAVT